MTYNTCVWKLFRFYRKHGVDRQCALSWAIVDAVFAMRCQPSLDEFIEQ